MHPSGIVIGALRSAVRQLAHYHKSQATRRLTLHQKQGHPQSRHLESLVALLLFPLPPARDDARSSPPLATASAVSRTPPSPHSHSLPQRHPRAPAMTQRSLPRFPASYSSTRKRRSCSPARIDIARVSLPDSFTVLYTHTAAAHALGLLVHERPLLQVPRRLCCSSERRVGCLRCFERVCVGCGVRVHRSGS